MIVERTAHGFAPRVYSTFAVGLLTLSSLSAPAMARGDWMQVERLRPGVPTRVHLHNADPASGRKRISGQFESADTDSISLKLRSGQAQTFAQDLIRKVTVRRPVMKRYAGWIGLGATVAVTWLFSAWNSKPPYPLFYGPGSGLAAVGFWRQKWRDVYRVPPSLNDRN